MDSDSQAADPSDFNPTRIWHKQCIYVEIFVADEVEDAAIFSLNGIAEHLLARQKDSKVGILSSTTKIRSPGDSIGKVGRKLRVGMRKDRGRMWARIHGGRVGLGMVGWRHGPVWPINAAPVITG